jgi:hypothetical protein
MRRDFLHGAGALPYGFAMRKIFLLASACSLLALPALAATKAGPVSLGQFGEWTAAEYTAGGAHVCYAFTRAIGSAKTATAGMILVTERPTSRDEVVVNATSNYPSKAEVAFQIDTQPALSLYTAGHSAYARDGRAAVVGMQRGSAASASWATKGGKDGQKFSLSGFSAAYGAIVKACPPK